MFVFYTVLLDILNYTHCSNDFGHMGISIQSLRLVNFANFYVEITIRVLLSVSVSLVKFNFFQPAFECVYKFSFITNSPNKFRAKNRGTKRKVSNYVSFTVNRYRM